MSENSVPLNPMVNDHYLSLLNGYFIGNIPYFQTNPFRVLVFLTSGSELKSEVVGLGV